MIVAHGVTRRVWLTPRWAVKVPQPSYFVRGLLGNRSEWKQRFRLDVNPPLVTLGYLVSVYRRADEVDDWDWWPGVIPGYSREESKPSSWGRFAGCWLLIDFDRAWEHPRGPVGAIYYGRQERLARKWADL